ncbi:hypothetical protein P12x_005619 [Tundrisphaera lichenicola]|uniref:hypothetical protein n=1 Tax=Tundrisphaera lichenicola TaxID=2029860 RepID=UPI003EBEAAEC
MASEEDGPEPAPTLPEPVSKQEEPRPSLLRSLWRGAKRGFRWVSYVTGAIAAVPLVLGLALAAFGLGTGRGWGIPGLLTNSLGFWLVSAVWGGIIGAILGLVIGLIPRAPAGSRRALWGARLARPVPFLRRKRGEESAGQPPAPRSRSRRWAIRLGLTLLAILAISAGIGTYLAWKVDRRLEAVVAEADQDDPSWRWDDLLADRDPVPDEENSALFVADALSFLPRDWPATSPATAGDAQGTPDEVSKAYDVLSATPNNVLLSDEVAETLQGAMDAHSDAVAIARTVAEFDRGQHEFQPGPTLIDTPLPETQAARTAARLLAADAAVRDHFGDPDGALDSCRAILGVGRSIGDEPFLISQLVRIAIGVVAMQSSRRVLAQSEPSDEALARLQDLILDEFDQPLLLDALKGERAILIEVIRRIATNEIPISALSSDSSKADPRERKTVTAPWGRIMYENQMALGLEWMNQAVDIARQPPSARPPLVRQLEAEVDRVRRSWQLHFNTATLPVLMIPALSASYTAHSRYLAELGSTAILIAAERHRLKTGSWPDSIESIDPEILPDPPVDPFSGQPFRLLREGGQFLIYSIGANAQDERGDYQPKKWRTDKHDDVGARGWDVLLRGVQPQPAGDPTPPATTSP